MTIFCENPEKVKEAAAEFLNFCNGKKIFAFYAEMGAGKTTFIKGLCECLGCTELVSSPTFSIVNEYEGSDKQVIYHFDFYRIKNEAEAADIGFEEYLDSGGYCF